MSDKIKESPTPEPLREAFEAWISGPPYERRTARYPDDGTSAWPGNYVEIDIDLAWCAWQAAYSGPERERVEANDNYLRACRTIAAMHAAAVGEVTAPRRGVVEDVADLRDGYIRLNQARRNNDRQWLGFAMDVAALVQCLASSFPFANEHIIRKVRHIAADAARYRWLRDVSVPPHNFYISTPIEFQGVTYKPDEVDALIDAARGANKEASGL